MCIDVTQYVKVQHYVNAKYENPLKNSEKLHVLVKGYYIQ